MNSIISRTVLRAGLVAGVLDIIAAILINVVFKGQTTVTKLLQYIASGLIGKTAFGNGFATAALGLLLHFAIAFIFTIIFVLLYPRLKIAHTQPLLAGIVYGILVWLVMNAIVIPIAFAKDFKFNFQAQWLGIIVIIACVGIPVALITRKMLGSRRVAV